MSEPATAPLSRRRFKILWHALAMRRENHRRSLSWWLGENHRNRFIVSTAADRGLRADVAALVDGGFLAFVESLDGVDDLYRVTDAGIRLAKAHWAGFHAPEAGTDVASCIKLKADLIANHRRLGVGNRPSIYTRAVRAIDLLLTRLEPDESADPVQTREFSSALD